MSVDHIAALISVLKADAVLIPLLGTRVFGGELPDDESKSMPRSCMVVSPSGGFDAIGGGYSEYGASRVDTICYGATMHDAWAVYLAVHTALKQMPRQKSQGVLLHWAKPLSKGTLARDPEKQWPTTLASWSVMASEIAAA